MELENNKEKIHQIILLDNHGCIHFSSDTLFSTSSFGNKSILGENPFLESIFPQLLELKLDDSPIRFTKMENPIPKRNELELYKERLELNNKKIGSIDEF